MQLMQQLNATMIMLLNVLTSPDVLVLVMMMMIITIILIYKILMGGHEDFYSSTNATEQHNSRNKKVM